MIQKYNINNTFVIISYVYYYFNMRRKNIWLQYALLSELVSIVPNLVLQIMFISHKMVTYLFQQTQLEWERWSKRGADERTKEDLHRWRWWDETHYQQGLGWVSGQEGQSRWSWLLSQLIDLLPHSQRSTPIQLLHTCHSTWLFYAFLYFVLVKCGC